MLGATGAGVCKAAMWEPASGVGVAVPELVVRGRVVAWLRAAGSMILVRLGRGELGREGGSWAGAGVLASSDIVLGVVVGGEEEVQRWGSADATRRVPRRVAWAGCFS